MSSTPPRHSLVARLLASRPPAAALEIRSDRVTAVTVADQGGTLVVAATVRRAHPVPSPPLLNAVNVHDAPALRAAVRAALERAVAPGRAGSRWCWPDAVAKVSLVRSRRIRQRAPIWDQLVRWQVRKSAPFRSKKRRSPMSPGPSWPRAAGIRRHGARRTSSRATSRRAKPPARTTGIVDLASLNLGERGAGGRRRSLPGRRRLAAAARDGRGRHPGGGPRHHSCSSRHRAAGERRRP